MTPLDIVSSFTQPGAVAANTPQRIKAGSYPYLFAKESPILRTCHISVALRQAGRIVPVQIENDKWRNRCRRASSHSSRSALWPSWRPVAKTNPSKSSLWLTQSPSQPSQPTLANTSKAAGLSFEKNGEQTAGPACVSTQVMRTPRPQQKGEQA